MKTVDELLKDLANCLNQLKKEEADDCSTWYPNPKWDKAQQLVGQIRWQLERENGK